ncbi:MAG: peptide/nickel transport system permease protein [Abditibacteriota bacterium]|nr:peptide/nickel transport system permease protein [Abditibacteriota bacterium]
MALAPTEFSAETLHAAPAASGRAPLSFGRRLLRHRLAQTGLAIIALLVVVWIFAPQISNIDPRAPLPKGLDALSNPHPPGDGFRFGADTLGRDVWTRTLYGTRVSLLVAFCAMLTATFIGTTIGLLSGYFGGWVDVILMRITETVMALPTILLAIAMAAVLPDEPLVLSNGWTLDRRLFNLLLAIALVTWTGIARAVRGEVLSLKEREFVEAARAMGCSHWRIVRVHLLPNVMPTVITLATLATAHNILLEAGLSFLNLGVEPATPSWGAMISEGQPYILSAPWIILVPGVAVVLAVAGFNLLGQAMQETLDPRKR